MGKNVTKDLPGFSDLSAQDTDPVKDLILHNDNVNTFDHVISCLVEICSHDQLQAEQCAYITHYKGKCDIRRGAFEVLSPMRQALLDQGLQVTID